MKKLQRQWKIKLIHHTHLDIGYTHTQDEVLKLQFDGLEKAIKLIQLSKDKTSESRFRWNPEILWAIDEWLEIASKEQKKAFIDYVKSGYIGLDGLYNNLLTGLCRPEELDKSFEIKRKIENLTGKIIDSAMITDIPGWNWGLVTALAEHNIKYLSCGTNNLDRIGYIKNVWKDKPFYWISPSGQEKVLVFVHGKGYSWFHTGPFGKNKDLSRKLNPDRISKYLHILEKKNYPYNTVIIRYNIGADNGPPDEKLSNIVERWNKENPNMQLSLCTTSQAMSDFESNYGHLLPSYQGDITPYWEDGAASTARETAIAREAGELLTQATTLSTILKKPLDQKLYDYALKNILLYNEHTWGAYNSITKPDHPFAISQWEWKRDYAYHASQGCKALLESLCKSKLLSPNTLPGKLTNKIEELKDECIVVYNTHSWIVSQLVEINTLHNAVFDTEGNSVTSQRLHNGNLAFRATDIGAFGSKDYILKTTEYIKGRGFLTEDFYINNGCIGVKIDKENGNVTSIEHNRNDLVGKSKKYNFNAYVCAKGKWGTKIIINNEKPTITVIDDGPVLTRVQIKRKGYKTKSIITDITIIQNESNIYITNTVDREENRRKEGIYFSFPMNIPGGRVKYDTIYGSAEVNKEQLEGANKNFICATRWLDVSNDDIGITCALIDAPMFKVGKLVHDPFKIGNPSLCGWIKDVKYDGTIHSYIMNNYWMTNYKADQPGIAIFRYVFMPHGVYDETASHKFAQEKMQKLIVSDSSDNKFSPPISISDERIIVSHFSKENDINIVRLFNTSLEEVSAKININGANVIKVISPSKTLSEVNALTLMPKETIALKWD